MSTFSTAAGWNEFLKSFAAAVDAKEWPSNPGATEEVLQKAEAKLKITLPPSYRTFLSVSNGWRNASRAVPVLRPVEKVRWFKKEHPDWVSAYVDPMAGVDALLPAEKDYFDYSQEAAGMFDVKHLAHTLCISEVGDSAVLLLNPMVVWPDGEWEAWFFADWLPGATRYRSFADWMRHELAEIRAEEFKPSTIPGELPTVYLDGPTKAKRRVRPREEVLTFEQALERLGSKTKSHRIKAVQQLARIGGEQSISTLIKLLKQDYDRHVRGEAAEMLGKLRAEQAIEPLIDETRDQSREPSAAIRALGNFSDEASAQRLLELVEKNGVWSGCAVYALAARNDPRAVPLLLPHLLHKDPNNPHAGRTIGRSIAQFERPGYETLKPLARHPDPEIRERVMVGVFDVAALSKDKSLRREAVGLIQSCLEAETDEATRRHLQVYIEVAEGKKG